MAWPAPPAAQGSVGEFSRRFQGPQRGNAHPGPARRRAILSAMTIAHDEREALRMLADSPNGSTESIMLTHGFAIGSAQWARDRGAADHARGAAANQGDVDDDYGRRAAGARRVEGRLGPAHVEDAGGAPSRLRRRAWHRRCGKARQPSRSTTGRTQRASVWCVRNDLSTGQIGSPLLMTQPTASLVISG